MGTLIVAILLSVPFVAAAQETLWPDALATNKTSAAPVASLVDGLAARLHEDPDDASGWLLLARSYRFLERPGDARLAYQRAAALGKTDTELAAWLALQEEGQSDMSIVHGWISELPAEEDSRDE